MAGETQDKVDVSYSWSLLSQNTVRAHQVLHQGITLPSVNKKRKIEQKLMPLEIAVIELHQSNKKHSTAANIPPATTFNKGGQLWADLINVLGGTIAFHKSAWQTMAFKFNNIQFPRP